MRMSKQAAAATRIRIIEAASRLLRERGIEATSIADVMSAAGLTHGGFYKHFQSKDELVVAALHAAFAGQVQRFDERSRNDGPEAALEGYIADYLSREHVAHAARGCPVAALGADAGRGSAAISEAMTHGVEDIITRYLRSAPSGTDGEEARAAAIRRLAAMVGAVVVARGVGPGKLSEEVLAACSAMETFPQASGVDPKPRR